jgi:hypothetical protein
VSGIKVSRRFYRKTSWAARRFLNKGYHNDNSNAPEGESLMSMSLDMKKFLWIIVPACLIVLPGIRPDTVFALSPDQVIALKKAGVSEETIRLMIQQEDRAQKNPDESIGRREIKDSQGNTVIIYSTGRSSANEKGDEEKKKVENSWNMLQNMMIDERSKSNPKTD